MSDTTSQLKTISASTIDAAREDAISALEIYRSLIDAGVEPALEELNFEIPEGLHDDHRFSPQSWQSLRMYVNDEKTVTAKRGEFPFVEATLMAMSPHWQDRIRAAVIHNNIARPIAMPPKMFCIYEPADSPKKANLLNPRTTVWISSTDEQMLTELLPIYQRMWAAYENQWPTSPNREFTLGQLDNVEPYRVYRPGTTIEDVISSTLIAHSGMVRFQDDDILAMRQSR